MDRLVPARLSVTRRPLLEIPPGRADGGTAAQASASGPMIDDDDAGVERSGTTDPDLDLTATFDVPAFLRRQES